MSVQTGSSTDQENLIGLLDTFLTGTHSGTIDGRWTQDDLDNPNDEAAWHHTAGSNIYVSMAWDNTDHIAVHHALGFTGGNSPGAHPSDSGSGGLGAGDRRVSDIGNGSFTAYHFFSSTVPDYVYVVLEYATGQFRHFGFGEMDKIGDWTGGEFVYGHSWGTGASDVDNPASSAHSVLADSTLSSADRGMTVHTEGLVGEPSASTEWAAVMGSTVAGNDTAAVARNLFVGGSRGGPYMNLAFHKASLLTGFIPMVPIPLWYRDTGFSPERWRKMGFMPGVRMVNMAGLDIGETFSVGGDTWQVFPIVRKQYLETNTEESWNGGIAYLHDTT